MKLIFVNMCLISPKVSWLFLLSLAMLLLEWFLFIFLICNFANVIFSFVGQLANDSPIPVMMTAITICIFRSYFSFPAKYSDYFVSTLISNLLELKYPKSNKIFCLYNMRKYFPLAYIGQYVYYTAMLSVTFHNNLVDSVTILGWRDLSQKSETQNILFNLYFENQCLFLVLIHD